MKEPEINETSEQSSAARWYIVHTYSGFEQRVQKTINELCRTGQDQGLIKKVVVPTEKVIEPTKGGQQRTSTRKFYPGYVMIQMVMTDLSWHLIHRICWREKPPGSHAQQRSGADPCPDGRPAGKTPAEVQF